MSSGLIDKSYEPHDVEKKWYAIWEERKLFAADEAGDRKPFSIVIPPPNVTGVLHMGHALNNTMQDILCRYRRLKGDNVLWMPGTDHAGIATQNVVERQLASQGTDRQQLGREKFVEAVWKWREESGSAIINQLKRLGASCDWDRERFTMDEGLSLAVRKVFVQLYKEGLIYRGDYIINWCPRCRTALSDLEVDHDEQEGRLYHIRYPFPGSTEGLVVATTRPETMLGDTAVAIHPDDERYFNIPGKEVVLPLTGRIIPVIRDTYVEMAFGTGALKVTPAHDPNDFQIGIRHNLSSIKVINDDGNMAQEAGSQFEGLDRFACREAVVAALKEQGLLERMEQHNHSVGHCYRCKTVVEPNLSKQWFVKATPLAKKAIAAVEDGRTRIIPESWTKTYYEWMHNIKDWCISRQIWWGHQIPAWTCGKCSRLMVEMEDPSTCESCGSSELVRETDVLDTWFSSALWPFSTMGWPDKTPLLKTFYPTSVLITGFDILFFWVARMMMMGIHFMEEVPFRDVYVHALVRDEHGKKMSKSKGNVIDPLEVIEKYGTDAFRFTLAAFAAMGRDIKLSEGRVEGYRHFINKLWNAVRFSLMHITEDPGAFDEEKISLADRWILSKNSLLTISVAESLDNYRFNEAAASLYRFVWHEFCDWYLEAIKPVLYGKKGEEEKAATIAVLWRVLKDTTVLLHPLIPFVTEEIWDKLPGTQDSIMKADYPDNRFEDPAAVSVMETIIGIITGIRNIRGEMNISPSRMLTATIHSDDKEKRELIGAHQEMILNLARLESMNIAGSGERPRSAATSLVEGVTIFVSLEGVIDFSKEEERLAKEAGKVGLELSTVQKKLNNKGFMDKAPEEVVQKVRDQNDQLQEKLHKIQVNLEKIREIQNS
ncbi:MAG: valine--tRNA ligase [Pseudomonadota bacterium]